MRSKRMLAAAVIGLVVLVYAIYALGSGANAPDSSDTVEESISPDWIVSASGTVVPARQAKLAFTKLGTVKRVAVQVGDNVRAGQVLVELDSADAQADVDTAQAALDLARAELALLEAGSRPEEVESAEAAYRGALARYRQMEAGATKAELESARAAVQAAEEGLAQAQASAQSQESVALARLDSARAALERLEAGAKSEDLKAAELALAQARNTLWATQVERDGIKGTFGKDSYEGKAADARVGAAETAVEIATNNLLKLQQGPTQEELRIARAAVTQAEAELEAVRQTKDTAVKAAESALSSARARLAQLTAGATAEEKAIVASTVESAKAALALRQAGPTQPAIEAAQARVRQAEGALRRAKAELDRAALVSPFDGTIAHVAVNEGETPAPGAPVVIVGDVNNLRIETTDLRETSVARVRVGQPVEITFDALPDQKLKGKVTRMAPMANPGSGGTNYTVTIEMDTSDPSLRWGMTANVEIDTR